MGGCASKPKEFDSQAAPVPVETPGSPKKAEAETVPQENDNGSEAKKEEPLVDLSEPAPEAPKIKETATEAKPTEVAVVSEESKLAETSENVEAAVEAKEPTKEGEKEVANTIAQKPSEAEVSATKAEDKSDTPLVEI